MKKKVFVTRQIPKEGLNLLKERDDISVLVYKKDAIITRSALLKGVKGTDAVLSLLTDKIDNAVLNAAGPQLKIISNYAVGFDNIDLATAAAKNIIVTNTPGVLTDAVAEHTFALMMSLCRRIPESDRFIRAGKYKGFGPMMLLGMELKGKTLGIVGLGRIGSGVAERAYKGMGMHIVYNDVRRDERFEQELNAKYMTIDELLKTADVVSIHVPLLPTTRHLINKEKLAMMKKTTYLINTSRGPIIDEKALVKTLQKKQIAGAALDVFENEPKLTPGLTKLSNVILTPHTASATVEARSTMAKLAAQSILDIFDGKIPQNVVQIKN